jgi:predicted transcriptional regulator
MTFDIVNAIKNEELMSLITTSIVRKILTSFNGRRHRVEYRRLRWIVCSRTSLTKWEANQILKLLINEGLIATTKPQANSERTSWLTQKGSDFLRQQDLN